MLSSGAAFMPLCICGGHVEIIRGCNCAAVHMWRSENNLCKLGLFFYCVDSRNCQAWWKFFSHLFAFMVLLLIVSDFFFALGSH